jgi:predicted phage tail protein
MILIGSLATMILLLDMRLRGLEQALDAKERSIRINIKGVEENLEKKMHEFVSDTNVTIGEFSKRIYR